MGLCVDETSEMAEGKEEMRDVDKKKQLICSGLNQDKERSRRRYKGARK